MRGLHATLATEVGVTGSVAALQLGHTSEAVTYGHYARAEAVQDGRQRRALTVLQGGTSAH